MRDLILLKAIVGSQAYGTNTPQSDTDVKGVYLQDPLDVMSFGYQQQREPDKDTCYYEVQRFLELLQSSNPTVLELLFTPEDCILDIHPLFNIILNHKQSFITKGCMNSFLGYAKQQIYKAKGLDKKMNWEQERIERKRPIDFMRAIDKQKVYPLTRYLKDHKLHEDCCGLVKIDVEGLYCLYYDHLADMSKYSALDNPRYQGITSHGYKGVCNDDMPLVSEVPIWQADNGLIPIHYNLQEFQKHCRDYNSYQVWLKERNTQRYVDVKNHGQMIDGKNMLHCYRLLEMAKEIAEKGEFNVRRPNAQELLKIRKGEVCLQELLDRTDKLCNEVSQSFEKSNIPDSIDKKLVDTILKEIRKESLKLFSEY